MKSLSEKKKTINKTDITKETLSKVILSLVDSFEQEHIEAHPSLFEYLRSLKVMDDFSSVELMVVYPIKELITSALKIKYKTSDNNGLDVVVNWSFYEAHLGKLIDSKEGFGCVCDKASSLLRKYINHKFIGSEPTFSETREHYWEPKFGTIGEWMNFIDSLVQLRYGNPGKYLLAYMALLNTGKTDI